MRILILDDDDQRHKYFARQFSGHEVVHTHTYKSCLDALKGPAFEVVFLDHDLNMNQYQSTAEDKPDYVERALIQYTKGGELDGRDVVEDMIKMLPDEKRPYQVIVHSWNPVGGAEMVHMLQDAGFERVIRWEFNPNVELKIRGKS